MKGFRRAYFTVEAAILFPFFFAFFFLCIYSLAYMYNRTLLSSDTYYVCQKIRESIWDLADEKREASLIFRQIKKEAPYLSCRNLSMNYSKRTFKILVESKINFDIPIKNYLENWFDLWKETISDTKYSFCIKSQNIMRMTYKVG